MGDLIRFFFSKIGWQLVRLKIINFRDRDLDPLSDFNKIGNDGKDVVLLLNVPISHCRTQIWNTLEAHRNPFVQTIKDYSANKAIEYKSSAINEYYSRYQPKNAAEVLKIKHNKVLEKYSPIEYVMPWEVLTPEEIANKRKKVAFNENKKEGKK